ncbi:MAG: S1 RNA-binding domain-containing protein [Eubacteriales bacterium]|nr:S1 RNA-binding domain-containing protein [Eubacteriales bacterium]MDD4421574.1 S1 RNA-binding domain-containing protein [Eubacteriales bacterium]HBR31963.1 RNA-binding protein S1 [Clostridiales bacterium]
MQLEIGSVVKGRVSGITKFGAFITLDEGKTGLVHISEISKDFVNDINEFLKIDQEVEAVVLSVDEKGRIALSMRRFTELQKNRTDTPPADFFSRNEIAPASFEDMMHKFKTISDDKMTDLKKGVQAKRGVSYKKGKRT